MKFLQSAILASVIALAPQALFAAESAYVNVYNLNTDGTAEHLFSPFAEDYSGASTIAIADLGSDGVEEMLVSSGPGLPSYVKLFRQDGSLISEFLAYAEAYRGGLTVAACDLTGDGINEIITGTMIGGGPHVRIFSNTGEVLYGGGFFAYADSFRGGVNVACGDIDNDGTNEIVTGAGVTGGPHIKVLTPDGVMKYEIFAGSAHDGHGVTVAVGDVNGDGKDDVVGGVMGEGTSNIMTFQEKNGELRYLIGFTTYSEYESGLNVLTADVDNDGTDEIGVATRKHDPGMITFFENTGAVAREYIFPVPHVKELFPTVHPTTGNVHVISAIDKTSLAAEKSIKVDISEQRLYAYERGIEVNTFLVSTGTYQFPTPLGEFAVTDKLLSHDYIWSYGPNNPNNYNIPDVKFNLRFFPSYYIHSATWHNNFGNRMSHGCVNVSLENAEWIYNWADVGTQVEIVN